MPKRASNSDGGALVGEVIRAGVREFVPRFARRHRRDGLTVQAAAAAAAREVVQEVICGFLGIPGPQYERLSRGGGSQSATPAKKIAPRAHSGATARHPAGGRRADPELERLERLKRFVAGTPGERKKAR